MPWTVREGVEIFHLTFLAELGTKLDQSLYAVKGGCNLRFFFHSIRYSEDLDMDVDTTSVQTLRRKVDRLLSGASLQRTLASRGVQLGSRSAPKQTETTQRWKIALMVEGKQAHTKVEFSRRGLQPGREFGPVDGELTAHYGLARTMLSHYGRPAALQQKVLALLGRTETQARDVFDLDLLLASQSKAPFRLDAEAAAEAQERAMSVDFDLFRSQVLAYLPLEQQRQYDDAGVWERHVERVVDVLGKAGAR